MANIKHYGILGMRWGKRRDGGSVTVGRGVRGAAKEVGGLVKDALKDDISKVKNFGAKLRKSSEPSVDYSRTRQLKKKPIQKLSNDELKTVITRLQLEKQYKDLSSNSVGRGRGILTKLLVNFGAQAVNVFARSRVDPNFVSAFEEIRRGKQSGS